MIFTDSLSRQATQKEPGVKTRKDYSMTFFDVKTAVLDQQILITVGMATEKKGSRESVRPEQDNDENNLGCLLTLVLSTVTSGCSDPH